MLINRESFLISYLIMEYAASVWDLYHLNDILALEKVQRRAARWVMNDYSSYSSVSSMLNDLNWPSLHFRRRINRLQMFYKAIYNLSPLTIPSYFTAVQRLTRHFHPLHFVIPSTRTTAHQQSYFPRTIKDLFFYLFIYCYTGQTAQLILPRGLDWSQSNIRNYSNIYITIIIM